MNVLREGHNRGDRGSGQVSLEVWVQLSVRNYMTACEGRDMGLDINQT